MLTKNAILIIDDSSINRTLLDRILSKDYRVLQAENGLQGLEILRAHVGEVAGIILDLIMPVMNGYAFLEALADMEEGANLPVLVATADEGSEVENRCLKLGAWDFVRKPYNPNTVRLRLQNIISRSRLYLLEQMRYLAEHDSLTGLYNREKFFEATRQLLLRHPETTFVMVRFDVSRFRLVNTYFGEDEGNRLLRFIATCLENRERDSSLCTYSRMEADVFCFCEPYEESRLLDTIQLFHQQLRGFTHQYFIDLSYGIYVADDPDMDVEGMYACVSMAAERSKSTPGCHYFYYDASLSEEAFKTQRILNEMEDALAQRQFEVYLQPKCDLSLDLPCGAEALVRWRHPQRGMISPGEFIPVFEHNGFISRLDYYVWEEVCRTLRRWLDEGRNPSPISVNVSRVNLYRPDLVESIVGLVEKYDLPPRLLDLELTESAYMDNPDMMKITLEKLHEAGFLLMMDDFGSGYSSLNTLRDIHVDVLKIDMKFLPAAAGDYRSERILASVIRMAGWLGIPVIMEGVETREQRDFLESVNCGYIQGYFFARPMPVADYEKLVAKGESPNLPKPVSEADIERYSSRWNDQQEPNFLFWYTHTPMAACGISCGRISVLRPNRAFLSLFRQQPEDTDLWLLCNQGLDKQDREAVRGIFEQAVARQEDQSCEVRRSLSNGAVLHQQVRVQYVEKTISGHLVILTLEELPRKIRLEAEAPRAVGQNHAARERGTGSC